MYHIFIDSAIGRHFGCIYVFATVNNATMNIGVGEVSAQVLCSFLIGLFVCLVLSCMSSLYILDINLLLELFANIFSLLVSFIFVLLVVSFAISLLNDMLFEGRAMSHSLFYY